MLEFIVSLLFIGKADINENCTIYTKINPPHEYAIKIEYKVDF